MNPKIHDRRKIFRRRILFPSKSKEIDQLRWSKRYKKTNSRLFDSTLKNFFNNIYHLFSIRLFRFEVLQSQNIHSPRPYNRLRRPFVQIRGAEMRIILVESHDRLIAIVEIYLLNCSRSMGGENVNNKSTRCTTFRRG